MHSIAQQKVSLRVFENEFQCWGRVMCELIDIGKLVNATVQRWEIYPGPVLLVGRLIGNDEWKLYAVQEIKPTE